MCDFLKNRPPKWGQILIKMLTLTTNFSTPMRNWATWWKNDHQDVHEDVTDGFELSDDSLVHSAKLSLSISRIAFSKCHWNCDFSKSKWKIAKQIVLVIGKHLLRPWMFAVASKHAQALQSKCHKMTDLMSLCLWYVLSLNFRLNVWCFIFRFYLWAYLSINANP